MYRTWRPLSALALLASLAAFSGAQQTPPPAIPLALAPAVDDAPTKAKSYDWMLRHQAVVDRVHKGPVDLLLVGDSITHGWAGDPGDPGGGQGPRDLWDRYFKPRNTVNLGFGWDRTEHVIWRLQNGEIDGVHPKVAVVLIGTNNLWRDSTDDIAAGVKEIVHMIHKQSRRTKILLLGIFPRDHEVDSANRKKIAEVNSKIADLGKERGVTYLDLGPKFLEADGTLSPTVMNDYLHPNHHGYEIWAEAMEPTLAKLFGDAQK